MSTYFALAPVWWLAFVLGPISFRMGFDPLSEASLHTLSLPARLLVVLTAAAVL